MRRCTVLLLLLVGSWAAQPARADTLDTLLSIAAEALGEPWLKDARPIIECVRDHGAANCAGMQIKTQANAAAKQVMPNDPLIQQAIQLINAVDEEDWLKVIETAGGAAIQATCKFALSSGSKVKEFMCDAVGHVSDSALKAVFKAVRNPSVSNLVNAIGAIGDPGVICELVPDFPAKAGVCGPLGSVIQMTKDLAKEAAKAGKDIADLAVDVGSAAANAPVEVFESICEFVSFCDDDEDSKPKFMSEAAYYKYVLFPKIQNRVTAHWMTVDMGPALDSSARAKCLIYYQYFQPKLKGSVFAQAINQRCTGLAQRWGKEGELMADTLVAATTAYYTAAVVPQIPFNAVEDYKSGGANKFSQFMQVACASNLETQFPMPKEKVKVITAWDTACDKLRQEAAQAWLAEKAKIDAAIKQLASAGCADKGTSSPQKLLLRCTTAAGYQGCLSALSGGEEKNHCAMVGRITHEALEHAASNVAPPLNNSRGGRLQAAETNTVGQVDSRVIPGAVVGSANAAALEIASMRTTVAGLCTPQVAVTVHVNVSHSGPSLPAGAATLRILDPARRDAVLATAAIPALSGARAGEIRATFVQPGSNVAGDRRLTVDIVAGRGGSADVKLPRPREFLLSARQLGCANARDAATRSPATRTVPPPATREGERR
jgi:hypothetical protein